VLKRTSASLGLVITSALFAPLTSSPAYAHANQLRGRHGHHHRSAYSSHHRNRNWNGNRHHKRIFIRIYIYNKNNNHAVALARPEHEQREVPPVRQVDGFFGAPGGLFAGPSVARRPAASPGRVNAGTVPPPA
jgi:hypothetical protein